MSFKQSVSNSRSLNKCWNCLIGKGHRAFFCENKGKPGYPRKPTAEDLKA